MLVHTNWLLTAQRAAVHRPTATAVIADLHLGYDAVRRRSGEAVPAVGLDETLALLGSLVRCHDVRRLVIAGDLCESAGCGGAVRELLDWLAGSDIELVGVVPGNHDRRLAEDVPELPLVGARVGVEIDGWSVLHGDGELPDRPVIHGHWHPCLKIADARHPAPCFLLSPTRLVLPAFSNDAAGANVLTQPGWRSYRCAAVAGDKVLDFGDLRSLRSRLDQLSSRRG